MGVVKEKAEGLSTIGRAHGGRAIDTENSVDAATRSKGQAALIAGQMEDEPKSQRISYGVLTHRKWP